MSARIDPANSLLEVVRTMADRRAFARLLGVRLLFAAVATVVLVPALAWFVRTFGEGRADFLVTNYDLAGFFLSPRGLWFLTLSGLAAFTIFFVDLSGMVTAARGFLGRVPPPTVLGVLFAVKRRLWAIVRLSFWFLLGAFAAALPVLACAGIAMAFFLGEKDINFYLAVKPPAFWKAAALAGAGGLVSLFAALVLFSRGFLAVPIVLFEGTRPLAAIRESWRRTGSNRRALRAGLALAAIHATTTIGFAAVNLVVLLVEKGLFRIAGERLGVLVFAAAGLVVVEALLVFLAGFLSAAATGVLVAFHYLDAGGLPPEAGDADGPKLPASALLRSRIALWVGAGAFAVAAIVTAHFVLDEIGTSRRVACTAHRGSSLEAPENTLSAIRQAIADGAHYAEIDVQLTGDGEVVLVHDADLMRVAGVRTSIADLTREERLTLDVGSWFSPEFAGEPLPTLEEAIETAREGGLRLNIELKFGSNREGLARAAVDVIRSEAFEDECVVTSLDYEGLRAAKAADPELECGLIVTQAVGDIFRAEADFLSLNASQVNRSIIARARALDKAVHVWTVNEPAAMNAMIDMGVDNIITDAPRELATILRERSELGGIEYLVLRLRSLLAI